MKFIKLILFAMGFYLTLNQIFRKTFAEFDANSIINIFCLENVKAEMHKAKLEYKESYGQEVCDCYIKKLSEDKSHEKSISECKIEFTSKINVEKI
tara:strand:- start:1017 stop:1304 length:288 start_codon:yes stop_codon:yes gene_type:complete